MIISRLILPVAFITSLLTSGPLHAADAFLIRHARIFQDASVIEDSDVIIHDGVIQQVGKRLTAPAGATVIDAAGKMLLPGLIDCHVHILAPSVLRQAAAFGVTTELDMFMAVTVTQQLRAGDEAKNFARADFRTAGTLATAPKGHGTQYGVTIETLTAPQQAEKFVDARIAEGSDYIKIIYDDGSSVGMNFGKISRETMAAVIAAAHAKGKLAVVHVTDQASAREAIEAGADGLVHVFIDEPADPALLKLAKEKKIFVIPTLAVMENYGREGADSPLATDPHLAPLMTKEDAAALRVRFPRRSNVKATVKTAIDNVAALHKAGVRILAGTDTPNPGTLHGVSLHRELELLVNAGLTPAEALAAATLAPADAFKLTDRGRIAPGKRADLVLVDGDPNKDIKATRAISAIWIAGHKFDRDGYQRMIDERKKVLANLAAPGKLLVSDFEDGPAVNSTFGAGWSISTDQIQRGKSTAEFKIVEGGADDTKHALLIKGSINPPLPWAWAGVMFSPGPRLMAPADLSGKKSISFWTKGDGKPARLMLFSRSSGFTPAFVTFTPGEKWERHTFAIKEFRDNTGKDLIMIIFAGGVEHGPFEYQIDQVMFE
jgi:imidazolonepropionase-like amidohydrolase